ncbi:MAG: Solute carrier family 34 [Marinimicrobia bacterium 46_47]|nr:MAG: Solute carrier family 34 [Marinimicrobia bacterium 46_47]
MNKYTSSLIKTLQILGLLYLFLLSIELIGLGFKLFGQEFAHTLMETTSSPYVGLFIGILVTSMVQSSSTVTSIVVGMVAGGTLTISGAIPIVMGSNIGTSVTNIIVSMGSLSRRNEFRSAFSAAVVHDFFNVLSVIILFPLQISFNFLGVLSKKLADIFVGSSGVTFNSPLKLIVNPLATQLAELLNKNPVLIVILALIFLFIALRYIVVVLKSVFINKAENFFDKVIFKSTFTALAFGLILTVLVQSSSITTSLIVPIVGSGILTLYQVFPYTVGANIGTTITAILASLVTGKTEALIVAFAHFMFNVSGAVLILSVPFLRNIPLWGAKKFSELVYNNRYISILFLLIFFFIIPLLVIFLSR